MSGAEGAIEERANGESCSPFRFMRHIDPAQYLPL